MTHFKIRLYTIFIILLAIFQVGIAQTNGDQLVIAISKERALVGKKYSEWLANQQIPFRYIDLSKVAYTNLSDSLAISHGLVLTGGEDIYPGNYGKEHDTIRCGNFDIKRDSTEFEAFRIASKLHMPVLGICRGMQLINIASGGTLYIDLPEDTGSGTLHRQGKEGWTQHKILLKDESLLSKIATDKQQEVASNHHQGIEKIGKGLVPAAYSEDSLIEAVEGQNSFLLAVQWHPEWMDYEDQLSAAIARTFLEAAGKYQAEKQ